MISRVGQGTNAWRVAVLCGLTQVLDGYDHSAVGLAVPALIQSWSISPQAATQVFVFSSLGILLGTIVAGPAADRLGCKPLLMLSVALFGLFSLATAWATSLQMLAALRFLTGIGLGGAVPVTAVIMSEHASPRWRTLMVMVVSGGLVVGGFFAGQLASQILPLWGWPAIFHVGGVLPLLLLVALIVALPDTPAPRREISSRRSDNNPIRGLFTSDYVRLTVLLWCCFFVNMLNMHLIGAWLPTVLSLEGMGPAKAAFAHSMYSAGALMSAVLVGSLIDRTGPAVVLAIGFLVGSLSIAIISTAHLPDQTLLGLLAVAGAGFVGGHLAFNGIAATIYPTAVRATGVGWALGVGRVGAIAGPVVGGTLLALAVPPPQILLLAAGLGVVTAILAAAIGLTRKAATLY